MIDGVLRMLPPLSANEQSTRAAFDFEHRRYQTASYLRIGQSLIDDWLEEVRLPASYFRGRRVLDLGCGSGRWSYAMAKLGAEVVSVDVSDGAVETTRRVLGEVTEPAVIQASLFQLPFEPGQFDFVVCWGVMHHTHSTSEAFKAVAPLVKPGGIFHMMVYERRSPMKVWGTEVVRALLRHVSPEVRYRFCGKLVLENRLAYGLLRGLVACVPVWELPASWDRETAQFGLYDWYSPRFNHLHRVDEVEGWFQGMGFGDIRLTRPVKYDRPLDVFRFGQCGGSIHCRGRRSDWRQPVMATVPV
jgi:2-polyprenyl-3-methyl-5-hydroxy-6-metoxy-1,4-benzoquinol methylase